MKSIAIEEPQSTSCFHALLMRRFHAQTSCSACMLCLHTLPSYPILCPRASDATLMLHALPASFMLCLMLCLHALPSCSAFMLCRHALPSCSAVMLCLHALPSCSAFMLCLRALPLCFQPLSSYSILGLRAPCFAFTLQALPSCSPLMLYLNALPSRCLHALPSYSASTLCLHTLPPRSAFILCLHLPACSAFMFSLHALPS